MYGLQSEGGWEPELTERRKDRRGKGGGSLTYLRKMTYDL